MKVSFQHRVRASSLISETLWPAASEGHTDLQLCVWRKFKQTEAPGPGAQSYPTAETYLKFTYFQPVAKTLSLYLFPTHRIVF